MKTPKPSPPPPPPVELPQPDQEAVKQKKKQDLRSLQSRSGARSTIFTRQTAGGSQKMGG